MRKLAYLLTGAVLVLGLGSKEAAAKSMISGKAISVTDQAAAMTPVMDVGDVSRLSVQINYTSSTVANVSFVEGVKSTATITVTSQTYVNASSPTLTINGVLLSYTVGASSQATATNIAAAINANASLNTIIVSTALPASSPVNLGIVYATATFTGVNNYAISSSSWAALTPSGFQFDFGAASDVTSATDIITKTNTYGTAQGVALSTNTNVALGGLTFGTTYFVIPVQRGVTFKLATTAANAIAGTAIDISTSSAGGGNYTLLASSTTTGASFVLQQSNDNVNWVTAQSTGTVATITVGPPSGTAAAYFDLGYFNAKYLRLNYTAPTRGGMDVDAWIQGKNDE